MITISVGICAYNEEQNISNLLNAILKQETNIADIIQIYVISCSTDKTNHIVKKFSAEDSRIKLLVQKNRHGKASAINMFLKNALGDVVVLESADTLPANCFTIEKLVEPFKISNVGMTGGRPIPTNAKETVMGFICHLLWAIHHEISLEDVKNPKVGEIVAFRNLIKNIPNETAVDEAWIEMAIKEKGLSILYVPDAIVYNHGPENIFDFLMQRRRITSGHIHLKQKLGYEVASMKYSRIINSCPKIIKKNSKKIHFLFIAIFFEVIGRFLGFYDFYLRKKNPFIWDMATSTKKVKKNKQIK